MWSAPITETLSGSNDAADEQAESMDVDSPPHSTTSSARKRGHESVTHRAPESENVSCLLIDTI